MSACSPDCLCRRAPENPTLRLHNLVATLEPGLKVRVQVSGHEKPYVGKLRLSANSVLAEGDPATLYLDVRYGFIVRDSAGRPGFSIRSVEVLNPATTTREERLEVIDEAADEWLIAMDALESAPSSEREAALVKAQEAYAACLAAFDAPYEVTEGADGLVSKELPARATRNLPRLATSVMSTLADVESIAKSKAIEARARGWNDRAWLDVLALLERALRRAEPDPDISEEMPLASALAAETTSQIGDRNA